MINDSVEDMQDATVTTPRDNDHSFTLTDICLNEVLCQSETNASDGLLRDINVQPISKASANISKDRRRDVDHFFSPLFEKDRKIYRNCHLCS